LVVTGPFVCPGWCQVSARKSQHDRKPLTKSRIERAKVLPGAVGHLVLWDSVVAGFGVRCLAGGAKTFV
jgi:hypothetical protein